MQFRPEIYFLGKFGVKNENYQLKLKFGTWTNSHIQNSVVTAIFRYQPKIPLLGKLDPKNQNCQFKLKFGN